MTGAERVEIAEVRRLLAEQGELIRAMAEKIEAQGATIKKLQDYLMEPKGPGKPSRAVMIDRLLEVSIGLKVLGQFVKWTAGVIVACAAAWAIVRGWIAPGDAG